MSVGSLYAELRPRVYILPRVLRDVSTINTTTRFFDWTTSIPIAFAPSAMQKLAGGDGELDVGRIAAKLGLNMTLSSQSTTSLEDVMDATKAAVGGDNVSPKFWFQIYLTPDMEHNKVLIKRAEGRNGGQEVHMRSIADLYLDHQPQVTKPSPSQLTPQSWEIDSMSVKHH